MRIVPGAPGEPRTADAGRTDTASKLKAAAKSDRESLTSAAEQTGRHTGRFLTRSQIVLQGFRAVERSLVDDDSTDVQALIQNIRFDGEAVLEPYETELQQIVSQRDVGLLSRLVDNTENNIRAVLGGRLAADLALPTDPDQADVERAMGQVVSRLAAGDGPSTQINADRVSDLLS